MKGLMKKEWYLLNSPGIVFLVITIAFAVIGGLSGTPGVDGDFDFSLPGVFAIIYVPLCAFTIFGAEEKWRWAEFVLCTPVSRFQVVLAKYLTSALHMLGIAVIYGGINLAAAHGAAIPQVISALTAALLAGAVGLPLMFWLGSEKGRAVVMGLMVFFAVFFGMFLNMAYTHEIDVIMDWRVSLVALPLGGLALYALSCPLAAYLYGRRRK